jgi:hypothetical protein
MVYWTPSPITPHPLSPGLIESPYRESTYSGRRRSSRPYLSPLLQSLQPNLFNVSLVTRLARRLCLT